VGRYLRKIGSPGVVIEMIADRTSISCGCVNKSRRFFTPYMCPARPGETFGPNYLPIPLEQGTAFVSGKALEAAEGDITVTAERVLFTTCLAVEGIPLVFEDA